MNQLALGYLRFHWSIKGMRKNRDEDERGREMRETQIGHGRNFIKLKSFIHFGR
jgi:hypothetical protein